MQVAKVYGFKFQSCIFLHRNRILKANIGRGELYEMKDLRAESAGRGKPYYNKALIPIFILYYVYYNDLVFI